MVSGSDGETEGWSCAVGIDVGHWSLGVVEVVGEWTVPDDVCASCVVDCATAEVSVSDR